MNGDSEFYLNSAVDDGGDNRIEIKCQGLALSIVVCRRQHGWGV